MPAAAKPLFRPDARRPHLDRFALLATATAARPKLAEWAKKLAAGRLDKLKETELLPDFLTAVFGGLLGRRLGRRLFPGAVVALVGPLGAGKTHFTRGVADGLHVRPPAAVTSPTFVLIQEYPARLPIYHFDTYRLASSREFADLGADEYLTGDGVCLVEWADKVADLLPADRLTVTLTITGPTTRRVEMTATGPRHAAALAGFDHPE